MAQLATQHLGHTGPLVTKIGLGCMGLAGTWNPDEVTPASVDKAIGSFKAAYDAGITLYDHADIYGRTACESVFKECLAAVPGSRERIVIATKCGILIGEAYNLSDEHILRSVEASIERMGCDYIDVYQMHRPDPLTHPRETAKALKTIVERGLVKHIAVSNYFPEQVRALQTYLDDLPIVSNQISISLGRLEPIYEGEQPWLGSGVLDQCMALGITPLAYSPLGGGWLSGRREVPATDPNKAAKDATIALLTTMAGEKNATVGQVATAWLLAHPAGIVPLVGSNSVEHIVEAVGALDVTLTRKEWYALWMAARGKNIM